jgi:hypothetical protein
MEENALSKPQYQIYGLYFLAQVFLPLAAGTCIYLFFRPAGFMAATWIGLSSPGYDLKPGTLSSILIGSLPDLLWCYAFLSMQLVIWGSWIKVPVLIKMLLYIIIPSTEFLQSFHLLPGTCDLFDIIFYLATFIIHYQINKITIL